MPETTITTDYARRRLTVVWEPRTYGSDTFLFVEDTIDGDFIATRMSAEDATRLRDALSSALDDLAPAEAPVIISPHEIQTGDRIRVSVIREHTAESGVDSDGGILTGEYGYVRVGDPDTVIERLSSAPERISS